MKSWATPILTGQGSICIVPLPFQGGNGVIQARASTDGPPGNSPVGGSLLFSAGLFLQPSHPKQILAPILAAIARTVRGQSDSTGNIPRGRLGRRCVPESGVMVADG